MRKKDYNWDEYAQPFSQITTRFQQEMYELASKFLFGSVVDLGCGAAKVAPYLKDNKKVTEYLGVDCSDAMIRQAGLLLTKLKCRNFKLLRDKIENVKGSFSSALSLQSYYSWPDTRSMLGYIFELLSPESIFVLCSANDKIDMDKLLIISSRENLMHPDWDLYCEMNKSYANNRNFKLVDLETTVHEASGVGFSVVQAHDELYLGGANFLVLKK